MAKKRHLTREEIIEQCKKVAAQRRTASRSPWTALSIVSAYALYSTEGFKGKKLQSIVNSVTDNYNKYMDGELLIKEYSDRLFNKAGWTIDYVEFTERDVTGKKGSYERWIQAKQIDPCNEINELSSTYLVLMFNVLMDLGYGEKRLGRVRDKINAMFADYDANKSALQVWEKALRDDAGIVFGGPRDPLMDPENL